MLNIVIAIISAYLLGSIPSAYIAGRLSKGIDIRQVGSKNMGAINVYYEVGLKEGILVLLADVAKGIGAILLAFWLEVSLLWQLLAGLTAVVGHIFPIFLKFRGGKGGATTLGILLFLMPKAIPFFIAIAVIALIVTRNLVFSYGVAFACLPLIAWFFPYPTDHYLPFSIGLPVFVGLNCIPGLKEVYMRADCSWRKVIKRNSIKERP